MAARSKRKRWWWILLIPVLGVVGLVSVTALRGKPQAIDPDKIARVEKTDLARSVVATGKIQPVRQVEIKSKASGIIQSLPVNFGDYVRKGQVICELDKNDLLPKLNQAKAALTVYQAQIESAQADYEKLKVDAVAPDLPFLKNDRDRADELFKQGLIPSEKRDEADRTYALALNKQRSAITALASAQAAIAKAKAEYSEQAAAVALAEQDLLNATITSPIDGVVLSRDSEVGGAVSSILTMGAGATLIMTLGDLSEVYVKGKVDESDIGRVFLGQPARITVESFKDKTFAGHVTKISPLGTEKDNVTTFEVRVSISNESRKLRALMTANAEIILEEHKGVVTIPEGAVLYAKDKSTEVEVPEATSKTGKKRIHIKTGISNGARTEVLAGLLPGQQVILQ
ncbi:MAG: efflux RND transporter periplasmic adaptor subunit [Acidobacteriaceae bacterium]|nr:efflux RND transporter periplasmic adaptor subunit [Acidobacteriaceae bacterium]